MSIFIFDNVLRGDAVQHVSTFAGTSLLGPLQARYPDTMCRTLLSFLFGNMAVLSDVLMALLQVVHQRISSTASRDNGLYLIAFGQTGNEP